MIWLDHSLRYDYELGTIQVSRRAMSLSGTKENSDWLGFALPAAKDTASAFRDLQISVNSYLIAKGTEYCS